MKLDKLTPEQEAMFPEFVAYGMRIGLRTDRTDRPAAERAIKTHYRACGLSTPEIRWFDSPYASVRDNVGANVGASVRDSVGASVRASVWDSVAASVAASVGASVRASVWDSVGASVRASVRASVGASVAASVRDSVWDSVGAHYDAEEAAWILVWDTYGISLPQKALTYKRMTEMVWWLYPGRDVVLASEPPIKIAMEHDTGRLHCESGKAVEFSDGQGFSAWRGQVIPDEWVSGEPPSSTEALTWRNMDQRSAACEIVGWHKILDELPNRRQIDANSDRSIGTLLEGDLPGHGPQKFLDCVCGTGRRFALLVPPESRTALHAQALIHGVPEEVIQSISIRT